MKHEIDDAMVERAMGWLRPFIDDRRTIRAALESALNPQRRYTDTPQTERRTGAPRACLQYGPIEMKDGTFQHRRRSDGENGLCDVVHNRSTDGRVAALRPTDAWARVGEMVDALAAGDSSLDSLKPPAEIFVSRAMEQAAESYMNGRTKIGVSTEMSPCTYAGIYRAMRAKELEDAPRIHLGKGTDRKILTENPLKNFTAEVVKNSGAPRDGSVWVNGMSRDDRRKRAERRFWSVSRTSCFQKGCTTKFEVQNRRKGDPK